MNQNELLHYGVKGMKWGVRKEYYNESMDRDMIIKKGTTVQNISKKKPRKINNKPVYGSHKKLDNDAYAGWYADFVDMAYGKAIKNELQVVRDIKIPSEKKAAETFYEMYKKDPKGISKSIAKSQADSMLFGNIMLVRLYNQKKYEKQLMNNGEEWLKSKGYEIFNQSIVSDRSTKARNTYFDMLMNQGYDGIRDVNDINNSGIEEPIIYFNSKNTLKNVNSVKLTRKDIELAMARREYELTNKK